MARPNDPDHDETSPLGLGRAGLALGRGFELSFGKMEIVNFLAEVHGFRRFLEIPTATTGARFGDADKRNFEQVHRLAYNIPAGFSEGLQIDFRSETLHIQSWVVVRVEAPRRCRTERAHVSQQPEIRNRAPGVRIPASREARAPE